MNLFLILSFLGGSIACLFAELPISSQLFSLPALITLGNGETGSGFFIEASNHTFLATARHVLFDGGGKLRSAQAMCLSHEFGTTNNSSTEFQVDLASLETNRQIRVHKTHDVVVVRLGKRNACVETFNYDPYVRFIRHDSIASFTQTPTYGLRRLCDVKVADDVYVFGYPSSVGLQQSPKFDYSKPLLRKGIVSGIYEKAQTIILDSAVYFGNSGGPVLEVEQDAGTKHFRIIGVISEMIPFVDVWENKRFGYSTANLSNSGYSVVEPSDFILELLWD